MSSDIRLIAAEYIQRGWQVVPVSPGEKRTSHKWQKHTYTPADFKPDDNIAGKCGEPSGWLVDVDCDCPEAVLAAAMLLPNTGLVQGRPGKLTSHYWFHCEGIRTTQFTDIKDPAGKNCMLVEIRSTGGYTVLPPSIWTDKQGLNPEPIAWEIERDALTIVPDALYDAVRNVAIATLCARHWPGSGVRHATVGHLTGFLLQGGIDAMTVTQIVKAAATIAKDADVDDRVKFARNTAAKFANGEPVTGGPKLAEALSEPVVAKMRAWLKLADLDAIEAMNQIHFWARLGKEDVIGREDDPEGVVFQRPRALYSEYAGHQVQVGVDDKTGEPKFKPLFPQWLESKERRRSYRKVVFAPPPIGQPNEPGVYGRTVDYNLWRGFALDPVEGSCQRFLEHLHEVICAGNDEHYRFLTKMCAQLVQNPGLRWEIAIALRGQKGTGKGTFMRVIQQIFGHHFAHLDRAEDFVKFNALISGKVVVFADEAFWAGDKREIATLNRIITEPTIRVTRKGIDSQEERSSMHLVTATNEEWAVPAGEHERRWFALDVSPKHRQDVAYFDKLADELKQGGAAAFLHDMLQVPVTQADIRVAPKTAALTRQQLLTLDPHLRWWHNCLYEGFIGPIEDPWGAKVAADLVYTQYQDYAREQGVKRFLDKIEFGKRMSVYFTARTGKPATIVKNGTRCWDMRDLAEAQKTFSAETGLHLDWPEDDKAQLQTAPF